MELTTKDNKRIAADFYPAKNPKGWVVYLHMMPATKESWRALAGFLAENGYGGIAIDLRGHGASEGGPDGYQSFSDAEHQASINDLEAALLELHKRHGAVPQKTALIGASIGANLALAWLAGHGEYARAVLLSAGLNYRGIETEPLARNLRAGQRVMLVTSKDDALAIAPAIPAPAEKELMVYDEGGHGTELLRAHPELAKNILRFLS